MTQMSFIRPEHLDIPEEHYNESSWALAQTELCKMNQYKAPKDKLVCLLNCCRVINQLMSHHKPSGADEFLPLLIVILLKANPPQCYSNLQYISRYRHPAHLRSEQAYFFTNAVSAVAFIEGMDHSSLSIDPEFFKSQMQQFHYPRDTEPHDLRPVAAQTQPKTEERPDTAMTDTAPGPTAAVSIVSKSRPRCGTVPVSDTLLQQVVDAAAEGKLLDLPAFEFVGRGPSQLKIGQIPALLQSYEQLASLVEEVRWV